MQIIVSGTMIAFSITQLARGQSTEVWLPILSGTTAYWLPSPKSGTQAYAAIAPDGTPMTARAMAPGAAPPVPHVVHLDV